MHMNRRPGESGLSMIELIIATAISLILVAGVYRVFISSTITYRDQDTLARLQENVRTAMDVLAREIRMAGSPRFTIDGAAFTGTPVTLTDCGAANCSDTVAVQYLNNIGNLTTVTFSVVVDPTAGPVLRLTDALSPATSGAVVDGVENMQVLLGLDSNADGSVDSYGTAIPAGNTVIAVRVRLLMRTTAESSEAPSVAQTWDVDGDGNAVAGTPGNFTPVADRRTRRIFTTTLTLRNQLQ